MVKSRWAAGMHKKFESVSDYVREPQQTERVHCLDWKTGRTRWTHAYSCDYGSIGHMFVFVGKCTVLLEWITCLFSV